MAPEPIPDLDVRSRLYALQRLLAQYPAASPIDVEDEGAASEAALLRTLMDGVPEARIRALSAELRSRAVCADIDTIDGLIMGLLLEAYRDAVGRIRATVQISGEKLRRCTTDLREAKRLAQRQCGS